MVLPTGYPNFLDASCCKVEVVKGAAGDFFAGFFDKSAIENYDVEHDFKNASADIFDSKFFGIIALKDFPSVLKN
jgi:hypothetical protein